MQWLLFPPFLERRREVGLFVLRLFVAFILIAGTQDNVFHYERMLEFRDFLAQRNTPFPLFSAHLSVYAQFLCGLLIGVGFLTRAAGLVMMINFVCAYLIVHLALPLDANWAPMLMFAASACLFLHGPGVPSVDEVLRQRRRKEWGVMS